MTSTSTEWAAENAAGYHPLASVALNSSLIGWTLTVQRGPDRWRRWFLRYVTAEAARVAASDETDRWVRSVKEEDEAGEKP